MWARAQPRAGFYRLPGRLLTFLLLLSAHPLLVVDAVVGAAAASSASWSAAAVATQPGPVAHFVQRAGTQFVVASPSFNSSSDTCQHFNFAGCNAFWLMVRAADLHTRPDVLEVLDKAASLGLTVLRTWAFSDGPESYRALQRAPGIYDENTFLGLDFAISEASKRGIRTLLAFGNYVRLPARLRSLR
jgi:hypothetical protein